MESKSTENLDPNVLNRLMHRIYRAERENYLTQKFGQSEMTKRIRDIITVEVEKNEN